MDAEGKDTLRVKVINPTFFFSKTWMTVVKNETMIKADVPR